MAHVRHVRAAMVEQHPPSALVTASNEMAEVTQVQSAGTVPTKVVVRFRNSTVVVS